MKMSYGGRGGHRPWLWIVAVAMALPGLAQTRIDLKTQGKAVDFGEATTTRPNKTGAALPSSCATGETFFLTTAAAGSNLYGCIGGTWRALGGGAVSEVFGRTGAVGAQAGDYAFSQISGTASIEQGGTGAATATAARTNLGAAAAVHTHALTDLAGITGKQGGASTLLSFGGGTTAEGDCAQFDAGGNIVSAGAPCGTAAEASTGAAFAVTLAGETAKTVTAAEHGFQTPNLLGSCYDTAVSPWRAVDGFSMSVDPASYNVVFAFPVPFTGRCILAAGGGGGGDAVAAGAGIVVSGTSVKTIGVDTSVVPFYLRGTFSADFATLATATCAQKTFQMPGARTGMTGLVAANTPFITGINLQQAKVPSTGTVVIELCNQSGGSYTPVQGLVYTVTLIGGF